MVFAASVAIIFAFFYQVDTVEARRRGGGGGGGLVRWLGVTEVALAVLEGGSLLVSAAARPALPAPR